MYELTFLSNQIPFFWYTLFSYHLTLQNEMKTLSFLWKLNGIKVTTVRVWCVCACVCVCASMCWCVCVGVCDAAASVNAQRLRYAKPTRTALWRAEWSARRNGLRGWAETRSLSCAPPWGMAASPLPAAAAAPLSERGCVTASTLLEAEAPLSERGCVTASPLPAAAAPLSERGCVTPDLLAQTPRPRWTSPPDSASRGPSRRSPRRGCPRIAWPRDPPHR